MINKNNCTQYKDTQFYICKEESDNETSTIRMVAIDSINIITYTAILIYELVKNSNIGVNDISLSIESIPNSITKLKDNKYDINTGIFSPSYSQYYCDYVGRDITFASSYADGQKSFLAINNNSELTASDFRNKKDITVYLASKEAGSYSDLLRYIDNNNISRDNYNFVLVENELDLFNKISNDDNAVAQLFTPHPLYSTDKLRSLGIYDTFLPNSIFPAMSNNYIDSVEYSSTIMKFLNGMYLEEKAFKFVGQKILEDGTKLSNYTVQKLYDLISNLNNEHRKYIRFGV